LRAEGVAAVADSTVIHPPTWPELLKPATAAAMLDISESTFRAIFPVLAARHGLRILGLSGPKFLRSNVVEVMERLTDKGLDISVDHAARLVRIGGEEFRITSTRSGKSGRGRPPREARNRT